MNVIIKRDNRKRYWTGSFWSIHEEDAIQYDNDYAAKVIKRRFGDGIIEYQTPEGSGYESRQRKVRVGYAVMEMAL